MVCRSRLVSQRKLSERAYKPDSVFASKRHSWPESRNATQIRRRSFLWAADRSTARCGLPEGLARTPKRPAHVTGRAGPPLLFGLAPRGVYPAADIAARAVGSYPTVSPLPSATIGKDPPEVWPQADHRFALAGGLFSVALSVTQRPHCGRPVPWRYQARCPTESGLSSSRFLFRNRPAIAQPARSSPL